MYSNPDYLVTIMQSDTGTVVNAPMPEEFMFDSSSNYDAPFAQGLMGNGALSQLAKLGGVRMSSQALTAQIWQGSNDTQLGIELDFQAEYDPVAEVRNPILALMKLTTPYVNPGDDIMRAPGPQLDLSLAAEITRDSVSQATDTVTGSIGAFSSGIRGDANSFVKDAQARAAQSANQLQKGKLSSADISVPSAQGLTPVSNTNERVGDSSYWNKRVKNAISIRLGKYVFFESVVITNVQKTYDATIDAATGLPMHARVLVQFKPHFQLLQKDLDNIFLLPQR